MTDIELGVLNTFDITEIAYELYKQDWVDMHTTREMRLDSLRNYYRYRKECIEEDLEMDSYEEWLLEGGYDSGLYVCFEEFCDAEYHDKEYIVSLLSDPELVKLYYLDIDNGEELSGGVLVWLKWGIRSA